MSEMYRDEKQGPGPGITTADLAGFDERKASRSDGDFNQTVIDAEVVDAEVEPSTTPRTDVGSASSRNRGKSPASVEDHQAAPLFSQEESKDLYARWDEVQVGFVDEPRQAVERADSLVAGAMKRLAEVFAEERARLEGQWDRGDSVSTEELRLALRRYRAFFGRLLSV